MLFISVTAERRCLWRWQLDVQAMVAKVDVLKLAIEPYDTSANNAMMGMRRKICDSLAAWTAKSQPANSPSSSLAPSCHAASWPTIVWLWRVSKEFSFSFKHQSVRVGLVRMKMSAGLPCRFCDDCCFPLVIALFAAVAVTPPKGKSSYIHIYILCI